MRVFVTHILPRDKALKYNLSIAACNFSFNLIEAGAFDKIYSIMPSFVRGSLDDVSMEGLIYSSLRKGWLHRVAFIIENLMLFRKIPYGASVWFYNVSILVIPLIVLLKLLKPSVQLYVIILDFTPKNNLISLLALRLINRMDGMIRLVKSPLFTCKNSICLPGVVPVSQQIYPCITHINKDFLVSGVLSEHISMLSMLLKAFSQMPDLTLHITGLAPNMDLLNEYTSKYKNIVYHGMVSYEEYLSILHNVSFLLSMRNPDFPENQCNFPSKIIEALLHNRIIISSLHYEQLGDIHYFEVSNDEQHFISDINRIINMPQDELLFYSNQSELVKLMFNTEVWINSISKLEKSE